MMNIMQQERQKSPDFMQYCKLSQHSQVYSQRKPARAENRISRRELGQSPFERFASMERHDFRTARFQ